MIDNNQVEELPLGAILLKYTGASCHQHIMSLTPCHHSSPNWSCLKKPLTFKVQPCSGKN